MDFQPIERPPNAFQQSVTPEQIQAVCHRVFGPGARVSSAVELGLGMYNTTYRVTVAGRERPVVVRFAPEPERQFISEREMMRNEYATVPHLAVIAPLMPRVLAADWSHDLIGRDYLVQTLLDGVPAPDGLRNYPRPAWTAFYRRIGEIARTVHGVRGPGFGPVAGPVYDTWSRAVIASLRDIAADLESVGLDAADLRSAAALAAEHSAVLDEITEPRLLTGDLWTVNVMIADGAPEPTITGVLDFDRTLWGDPAADWPVRLAAAKQDERLAFWEAYGERDRGPAASWRSSLYEVRHLGGVRLELHRHGRTDDVRDSYARVAAKLAELA
ncbi:phosphotransferase family protein [Nonomuraea jiangxiensis]|uniref:Predicted kinase, aminoglycoside phosphotransferase (APT) family n=1 Tax=Nonomuraea jiangxiensis TaxID=633440 RepID=A0A1G7ZHR7_9ACTN|nr:aminoglycoside phosphotransferase family protein [Nonomuraea jiangxiensis]SDH08179.1 Predicted kinase, aminoglycoside phosphotransferase (APT) family [Nonomuraea jiangxiensis]